MAITNALIESIELLGRYNVRRFPAKHTNESLHKYVRLNSRMPYLENKFLNSEPFQIDVPKANTIPTTVPIATMAFAGYKLQAPRGLKYYCSLPTFLTLAGLRPGSWSVFTSVSRNAVYLDSPLPMESPYNALIRKMGNDRWDDRYPQSLQAHVYPTQTMRKPSTVLVSSLVDFVDADREEIALCTDQTIHSPTFYMRCLINYIERVLHVPVTKEGDKLCIGKPQMHYWDIRDIANQCEEYMECLEHQLEIIRDLGDGNYFIEGESDQIVGIFPTEQRMVLDAYQPPQQKLRIEMDWVLRKASREAEMTQMYKEDMPMWMVDWWKHGPLEDEGCFDEPGNPWAVYPDHYKEHIAVYDRPGMWQMDHIAKNGTIHDPSVPM